MNDFSHDGDGIDPAIRAKRAAMTPTHTTQAGLRTQLGRGSVRGSASIERTPPAPQETAPAAEPVAGLATCPACGALPCDQVNPPQSINEGHLASVLTDIACGRGMFGVDAKADLEWAMWEAGKAVGVESPALSAATTDNAALVEALEHYRDQLCEGFCGEDEWADAAHSHPDMQRDCGGCRAAATLLCHRAEEPK